MSKFNRLNSSTCFLLSFISFACIAALTWFFSINGFTNTNPDYHHIHQTGTLLLLGGGSIMLVFNFIGTFKIFRSFRIIHLLTLVLIALPLFILANGLVYAFFIFNGLL